MSLLLLHEVLELAKLIAIAGGEIELVLLLP